MKAKYCKTGDDMFIMYRLLEVYIQGFQL